MKATVFSSSGEKKSQIELPKIFETRIREDIVQKYFEAEKISQPYSVKEGAGLRQVAFGRISHKRHDWRNQYGRGMSRVPRKTMSRRGTQFFWIAANMPGVRGGRKAHPPLGIGREKKLNKKEIKIAFNSAYAATAKQEYLSSRYASLQKIDSTPFIVESLPSKTKLLIEMLKKIFAENFEMVFRKKVVRAGKGKARGRKYKANAGVLLISSSEEKTNFKGIDAKKLNEVRISDLYPLGRLTIYTQKALQELEKKTEEVKK